TLRRIPLLDSAVRRGDGWTLPPPVLERTGEISGRTVGLVGYGEIPRRLAPVLQAPGAGIADANRSELPDAISRKVDLDTRLSISDIVSLHVRRTDETRHMIGPRALGLMKPGAILINTARGGLVDEAALAAALAEGRLAGAGLDVLCDEPAGPSHDL